MLKHLALWVIAASLAACGPAGGLASAGSTPVSTAATVAATVADTALPPPASYSPTANTLIDDKAVDVAFDALDTATSAIDTLIAYRIVIPGSPAAFKIADGLDKTRRALNVARGFQRAGQATSYKAALGDAARAFAQVKLATKGFSPAAQPKVN